MVYRRRKGIAIVDTSKGILLVAGRSKNFALPGGGAEKWESRRKAAIRELYEETGLKVKKTSYLFRYVGDKWHNPKGKLIRNHAKVFLMDSEGNARPRHEIKYIAFWRRGSKLSLTSGTKEIIERYLILLNEK